MAATKPKLVGINHIALEVGDLDKALAFYGSIFAFELRGRVPGQAFIDLGDQFLALAETPGVGVEGMPKRHFGLVVDDRERVKVLAAAAGATMLPGDFLDFLDPWGNRIEVIDYSKVQFTKADAVLRAMGVDATKTADVERQLREKGMGRGEAGS